MKQRKLNIFLLGLTALLAVGCLVGAAGTAWARYRIDVSKSIFLTPQAAGRLYLGRMVTAEGAEVPSFVPESGGGWEQQDGRLQLTFAVANGQSDELYSAVDQDIRICLIASPGVWDGEKTIGIKLQVPAALPEGEMQEIEAVATRIEAESPLHRVFGEGWVFRFYRDSGEEYSWHLTGGTLSAAQITLVMEGEAVADPSLLQLQVTGY